MFRLAGVYWTCLRENSVHTYVHKLTILSTILIYLVSYITLYGILHVGAIWFINLSKMEILYKEMNAWTRFCIYWGRSDMINKPMLLLKLHYFTNWTFLVFKWKSLLCFWLTFVIFVNFHLWLMNIIFMPDRLNCCYWTSFYAYWLVRNVLLRFQFVFSKTLN